MPWHPNPKPSVLVPVLLGHSLCNRPMPSQFSPQGSVADGMQPHQFPAVPPGLTTPRLLSLSLPLRTVMPCFPEGHILGLTQYSHRSIHGPFHLLFQLLPQFTPHPSIPPPLRYTLLEMPHRLVHPRLLPQPQHSSLVIPHALLIRQPHPRWMQLTGRLGQPSPLHRVLQPWLDINYHPNCPVIRLVELFPLPHPRSQDATRTCEVPTHQDMIDDRALGRKRPVLFPVSLLDRIHHPQRVSKSPQRPKRPTPHTLLPPHVEVPHDHECHSPLLC